MKEKTSQYVSLIKEQEQVLDVYSIQSLGSMAAVVSTPPYLGYSH